MSDSEDDKRVNERACSIQKLLLMKESKSFIIDPLQKKDQNIIDKPNNSGSLNVLNNINGLKYNKNTSNEIDVSKKSKLGLDDSFLNPKSVKSDNLSSIKDLSLNSKGHTQPDEPEH